MVTGGLEMDAADREALQKPVVGITLAFEPNPVRAEAFVRVRATVTNRVARTIQPIIRLVPTSLNECAAHDASCSQAWCWPTEHGPLQEETRFSQASKSTSSGTWHFCRRDVCICGERAGSRATARPRLALVSAVHTLTVLP